MGELKLQKIGNSFGFRIPKEVLDNLGFSIDGDYELVTSGNALTIIKREKHQTQWEFNSTKLSDEDKVWLEADLEEL